MTSLARIAAHRPRLVLALCAIIAIVATVGITRLRNEEDVLVFLPTRDPDVQLFQQVSRRFGSLRVALVGVEVSPGHDVFEPDAITKITRASDAIRDVVGVDRVVSLTTMTDVVGGADGAEVTPLVSGPPVDAPAHDRLRQRVLSRDHIVGTAVSSDGRAALLLVFIAEHKRDAPPTNVEAHIREAAERELTGMTLTFGGAPFAGRAIYAEAQADVWRLSPLALGVLLLVVLIAFRDPIGVVLTLGSVGFAALIVVGGMGWWGERWTVATATLPVILFASGSSYAVHVLGRYYLVRATVSDEAEAIAQAIRITGAPLAIAALTTSVGFYSFVATDIPPMRAFGIACGSGVLLCWLASLTLVPAVVALFPRKVARPLELRLLGDALVATWRFCARHRYIVIACCVALGVMFVPPMRRVRVRMEPRAFFRPGSDPARAEDFLDQRFGGATFVQVAMHGDFDQPTTLRELARFCDYARTLPGVTQVQSIVEPLLLVSDAMGEGQRLPQTPGQASNLYFFLQGHPEVNALLTEDRKEALVHIRVTDHDDDVVAALERYTKDRLGKPRGWPTQDDVTRDLAFVFTRGSLEPDVAALEHAVKQIRLPAADDLELLDRRERLTLGAVMATDAPKLHQDDKAKAELAVERQSEHWQAVWRAAAIHPDDVDMAIETLTRDIDALPGQLAAERALPQLTDAANTGALPDVVKRRVARVADDLFTPLTVKAMAASTVMTGDVAGEPVLDRGFGNAVERNQIRSLIIAVAAVFVFMFALFRKLSLTIVSMAPALLALVFLLGGMGIFGAHIDLGTSLVAGIATGAGADFAMHYLWYLRTDSAEHVSRTVGPIMLVSVALVALGFVVLGLGHSPVMHLFGGLAGGAMALSALLSCIILPAALGPSRSKETAAEH